MLSFCKWWCSDVAKMCTAPEKCNIYINICNEHDPWSMVYLSESVAIQIVFLYTAVSSVWADVSYMMSISYFIIRSFGFKILIWAVFSDFRGIAQQVRGWLASPWHWCLLDSTQTEQILPRWPHHSTNKSPWSSGCAQGKPQAWCPH